MHRTPPAALALLVLGCCLRCPAPARAAGPVGHAIIAQKTINDILAGSTPASADLKQALADPECQRAFRGGAVAPDIAEELSHYGKTGEVARNLVGTAEFYMEKARKSGSAVELTRARKQLAFAYGWLSHCATDLDIHPVVNGFTGDAWSHNDKGQKTIHAAREAQLSRYLAKLYPNASGPYDVAVPFDFMSGVTGLDEAKLRQAMGVLQGKATAEVWARGKVTLTMEQLEAIWGPSVRASLADGRVLVGDPDKMQNWDLDCGGRLTTEEFEALRNLVLELNGGKLPPGWAKNYVDWFWKTKGLSAADRRAKLRELMGGGSPGGGRVGAPGGAAKPPKTVKPGGGPALLTYRDYHPNKQLQSEYTYYLDANGRKVTHGMCRMWHDNGKLSGEVNSVHGKTVGLWKAYYYTGELMFEHTYADGKLNGAATRWYQSGAKEEQGVNVDGQKDGVWTEWHENGQKKGEDVYERGLRIKGKSRRWDQNGRELQLVGDW